MANRDFNTRFFFFFLGMTLFFFGWHGGFAAETRQFSFATSKGLTVKVLQDNDLPFIHAQLLIYLDGNSQNLTSMVISQLTIMNMFNQELNFPSSNLMDMLRRQGNDYQVELNPEFIKISINFLPDRLAVFPKLLKEIFNYQSFHLKKFNKSKANYWNLYTKNNDWKKEIAFLLAYQHLVGNFFITRNFLPAGVIKNINLAQLRSFLLKTFRPDNALLILKGKINPYIVLGMIEIELPQPPEQPLKARKEELVVNSGPKIFVVNVNSTDLPIVYFFEAAPAATDSNYIPYFVGNYALFGFPAGRIYQSENNRFLMDGYRFTNETSFMKNFSVICNYLRLSYNDLESFLLLLDQERRKFATRPIERKEYLDALNHYVGRVQVDTNRFDYDLQGVINNFNSRSAALTPHSTGPELFQEVSINRVMQVMDEHMGYRHKNGNKENSIVVIIGNGTLVLNSLKNIKLDMIDLFMD